MYARSTFAGLALLLVACSDDPASAQDSGVPIDAAYDEARCLIRGHFGDLGTKSGTTMGAYTVTITVDDGPPRDTFFLKLNAGRGAFAGGQPMPGTYALTGAELDATTCGVCVNLIADIVSMQGPTKFYFATGGTVTLTRTESALTLVGSLSNVTFVESTSAGAPVPGGCDASITAMAFN